MFAGGDGAGVVTGSDDGGPVADPKHEPIEQVSEIRDDIAGRVGALLRELDRLAA